jgi:hypothetical protein
MRGRGVLWLAVLLLTLVWAVGAAGAQCDPSAGCEGEVAQPVVSLRGIVHSHRGSSYRHPGYSTLELVSTPEAAYMTANEPRTRTHLRWLTEEAEGNAVKVTWDCRRPYQAFHYTLTARGQVGDTVTAHITFHAQISRRWCDAAKAREEAQRIAAERRRRVAEEEAARHKREQAEREAHETTGTCTNGTYVNSAGNTVCKPEERETGPPAGATAECSDGTYSFSESRSGTCSSHGGVARWL